MSGSPPLEHTRRSRTRRRRRRPRRQGGPAWMHRVRASEPVTLAEAEVGAGLDYGESVSSPPPPGPLRRGRDWLGRRPPLVLLVAALLARGADGRAPRPLLAPAVPAVLALGAVAGLADIAGSERLDRAARHLHPVWLVLSPRRAPGGHPRALLLAGGFVFCLGGELVAYAGYVLMVRDTAKVDDGPSLSFGRSIQTVVGGFGVFAATRTSGGFAVDYWALRSAGEDRDGAVARVLALGALEYAVLAPAALCSAIALLVSGEDVPLTLTLPWLLVIPGAFAAVWLSSPKRARRYADARDGGRIRQAFAHGIV